MLNIESLFLFIFCWSVLVLLRTGFIVVTSVFSREPKPIKMNKHELILTSITLSYLITYLTVKWVFIKNYNPSQTFETTDLETLKRLYFDFETEQQKPFEDGEDGTTSLELVDERTEERPKRVRARKEENNKAD